MCDNWVSIKDIGGKGYFAENNTGRRPGFTRCKVKKTNEEYSLLYDYYGALLSDRQREVFELYHEENLSLSEIAESLGVSRQAVHISLGKARAGLEVFEIKLGLISKHMAYGKTLSDVETRIDGILKDKMRAQPLDAAVCKDLRRIKKLVRELDF